MKKSERLSRENDDLRKRIELLEATVQRLVTAPAYVPYPVPIVIAGPIGPAPGTTWPVPYLICSGIPNATITTDSFVAHNTTGCASQS